MTYHTVSRPSVALLQAVDPLLLPPALTTALIIDDFEAAARVIRAESDRRPNAVLIDCSNPDAFELARRLLAAGISVEIHGPPSDNPITYTGGALPFPEAKQPWT